LTMPWLRASRPAGVFPFRFRRQPIFPVVREHSGLAVEFAEPLTVLIRRFPAHRINRCIPVLLMDRWIRACDRCKLILRDRRFPQIEVAGESDFALLFPSPMAALGLRLPMVKVPAGALIITTPTELRISEAGDFDMTIRTGSTGRPLSC
jgi:hypothetical protein